MCHNTRSLKPMRKQQGSMLVIALFIIIVISLLAASLSRILSSSADGIANEVYNAKATYAAESGIELGMYKALVESKCLAKFDWDIKNYNGLDNCKVNIECNVIDSDLSLYYLKSTSICDGGKIVAQHEVEAEVKL